MKGTAMHRAPAPRILATTATAAVATAAMIAAVGVPAAGVPAASPKGIIVVSTSAPASPASTASTGDATVAGDASGTITDADLDGLIALLESLPADLQSADSRTTPDYEQRLARALDRAAEEQRLSPAAHQATARTALLLGAARQAAALTPASSLAPGAQLAVDWIACGAAVAGFIAQYGIPVLKVVGWIREARALFGSAYDIYVAIRYGRAGAEMGEEAAQMLQALLGIDGVVSACFGAAAVDA
jgi:hypothetical protein